jgi:hypothetical protein
MMHIQNGIPRNGRRTKRHKARNDIRHITTEYTIRQKAQYDRRHKTAEGTKWQKAQNGAFQGNPLCNNGKKYMNIEKEKRKNPRK